MRGWVDMWYWMRLVERRGKIGALGQMLIALGVLIFFTALPISLLGGLPGDTIWFAVAIWTFVLGMLLFWKTDY